jgi:pimeloyl-ACP methyl ester carboxylesterase
MSQIHAVPSTTRTAARVRPLTRPPWLPKDVWPFESYGLEVGDSVLAVTEAGAGPALLLLHAGTWSFVWRDLMKLLSSDFRCICFDAPGNGRTLDAPGSRVSLEGVSRAVAGVVEALDLNDFTLVAHDLGGPAGIAALGRIPRRALGIVAMNTFAWKPSVTGLRIMLAIMGSGFMRELNVATGVLSRVTASNFGVGRHLDAPSRRAFLAGMGPRGWRVFHNYLRNARVCDSVYSQAMDALLGLLARTPLLTIFGERNDPFGFQKRWKELYPDARQAVVAGGNHFPMCDAPDFVANTIREWHRELA